MAENCDFFYFFFKPIFALLSPTSFLTNFYYDHHVLFVDLVVECPTI